MKAKERWDIAAPLLAKALEYQDTHDLDSVYNALDAGEAQLWCGRHSVILTEVLQHPLTKTCRIWLAAGHMVELVEQMLPKVEQWARENECSGIEIIGRHGWARVLKDRGYYEPHKILAKDLGDE